MCTVFTWLNAAPRIVVALDWYHNRFQNYWYKHCVRASSNGRFWIVTAVIFWTKVINAAAFNQVNTVYRNTISSRSVKVITFFSFSSRCPFLLEDKGQHFNPTAQCPFWFVITLSRYIVYANNIYWKCEPSTSSSLNYTLPRQVWWQETNTEYCCLRTSRLVWEWVLILHRKSLRCTSQ